MEGIARAQRWSPISAGVLPVHMLTHDEWRHGGGYRNGCGPGRIYVIRLKYSLLGRPSVLENQPLMCADELEIFREVAPRSLAQSCSYARKTASLRTRHSAQRNYGHFR